MRNSSSQRICKWCDKPLQGRRSKTYCNDVCKQAAYYHRRKSSREKPDNDVTEGRSYSVANHAPERATSHVPESVTLHTPESVMNHAPESVANCNNSTADIPQLRPEKPVNNQSNNHFKMRNNQNADRDTDELSHSDSSSASAGINVMGMGIDREFINGLLETMPEAEQRELSIMMVETVLERYPDLLENLGGIPVGVHSGSVTNDAALEGGDYRHEGQYRSDEEGQDGEGSNESNSDYYGNDDSQNGYGNNDDDSEVSEADENESPDSEDGLRVEAGDEDESDEDNDEDAQAHFVTADEPDVPVFRLGGSDGSSRASVHLDRYETRNNPSEHRPAKALNSHQAAGTKPHDGSSSLRHHAAVGHESSGNYLNRFFDSSRISRGMKVWEELSVTVPVFMESYVTAHATDRMIGVQSAGETRKGLVTLHILFHRSQHRRIICQLLGMVIEAEEGLLSAEDFRPDGSMSAHRNAGTDQDVGNDKAGEDDDEEGDDNAGPIDYDCYGSSAANTYGYHSQGHYQPVQHLPTQQSNNTVLQLLGIGVQRRA